MAVFAGEYGEYPAMEKKAITLLVKMRCLVGTGFVVLGLSVDGFFHRLIAA
jgi:hypothetical protein